MKFTQEQSENLYEATKAMFEILKAENLKNTEHFSGYNFYCRNFEVSDLLKEIEEANKPKSIWECSACGYIIKIHPQYAIATVCCPPKTDLALKQHEFVEFVEKVEK